MAEVRALRARQAFAVGRRVVRRGQTVRSDDDIVEGREHLFVDVLQDLGIEKATANPGERRNKPPEHVCDECGFEAASAGGLGAHQRSHN